MALLGRFKGRLRIFQELKPSEVRKECLKHSISATGNIDELIANLILNLDLCAFITSRPT